MRCYGMGVGGGTVWKKFLYADNVNRADARKYRSELSFTFLLPK